jgi:hypothetical protein
MKNLRTCYAENYAEGRGEEKIWLRLCGGLIW